MCGESPKAFDVALTRTSGSADERIAELEDFLLVVGQLRKRLPHLSCPFHLDQRLERFVLECRVGSERAVPTGPGIAPIALEHDVGRMLNSHASNPPARHRNLSMRSGALIIVSLTASSAACGDGVRRRA